MVRFFHLRYGPVPQLYPSFRYALSDDCHATRQP